MKASRFLSIVLPGLLVAATGVGMGDLATGSFAGSLLGTAILWAVMLGAFLKFIITEGIARWQLATGTTVLQGAAIHLGPWPMYVFLPYLLLWTLVTGSALMSGCGVALHALIPIFDSADNGKIFFGMLSSLIGAGLVRYGGFDMFEKIMTTCIVLMFAAVVITAGALWPGTEVVLRGLFIPTIPDFAGSGLTWTVALIGGVGGTVTILSYGYWIRESGREGADQIAICRIDLGSGYLMTAIFGISVVIIGSKLELSGSGATLIVAMADELAVPLGEIGRWIFLIGAVGAVFSSLLGTWQATPYFFCDSWNLFRGRGRDADQSGMATTTSPLYRYYLLALAVVPMMGLFVDFRQALKIYAVIGAFFVPMLAILLLVLNSRTKWIGAEHRNRFAATGGLLMAVVFFFWIALAKIFG